MEIREQRRAYKFSLQALAQDLHRIFSPAFRIQRVFREGYYWYLTSCRGLSQYFPWSTLSPKHHLRSESQGAIGKIEQIDNSGRMVGPSKA
jgi:hypothetical protein